MVHNHVLPILDSHQSHDQFGFRPRICFEDALVVSTTLISKTREWNIPLWIASLDLKKAFDKMFFPSICSALRTQGISDEIVLLLYELYAHQHGSKWFAMRRGVKQGDVINSIIFNAMIDFVFQRWKTRLRPHGWLLDSRYFCVSNIRYADDSMIFAKSASELREMLELFHDKLDAVAFKQI